MGDLIPLKIAFITSTPLNVSAGSGTYIGIATLAQALTELGITVQTFGLTRTGAAYTLQRLLFNELMRHRNLAGYNAAIGFDMDGYRLRYPHIASIKGVIADEMQYESGLTRMALAVQAACEGRNVHRARRVITTSRYAAERIQKLYKLPELPRIVPEPIHLAKWRGLFDANAVARADSRFIVLCVAHFYRRKRIDVLLEAARKLESDIPNLEVRIVGDGPEAARLKKMSPACVHWLGAVSQKELAAEYGLCDVFCLPSVQEGFGIVFLEAMAAGKAIVAVRSASVPEVVPHALLANPNDADSLAEAIHALWKDPDLRASIAQLGLERVKEYDAPGIARQFLTALV